MADIAVTIRVDKADAGTMDGIVERLRALGLADVQRQDRFGTLQGRLPAARLDEVRAVPGVASVREEKTFKALD
jgi:hypothetical protein